MNKVFIGVQCSECLRLLGVTMNKKIRKEPIVCMGCAQRFIAERGNKSKGDSDKN